MKPDVIVSENWNHAERVNIISTAYGNGPGQVTRVYANEKSMPCKYLDYAKLLTSAEGYLPRLAGYVTEKTIFTLTAAEKEERNKYFRSRRLLRYLLSAGGNPLLFCTLTFAQEPASLLELKQAMYSFIRRYWAFYHKKIKMLWVYERGAENGRVHVHAVILRKFIDKIDLQEQLWCSGFVNIKAVITSSKARSVQQIRKYVSKYMGKGEKSAGLGRETYHVTREWPDVVEVQKGEAADPLGALKEVEKRARAAGCPASSFEGFDDYGNKTAMLELYVPPGSRYMPDIRFPVPLRFMQAKHLAESRRGESVTWFTDIEARRARRPLEYMSTRKLTTSGKFSPSDYFQFGGVEVENGKKKNEPARPVMSSLFGHYVRSLSERFSGITVIARDSVLTAQGSAGNLENENSDRLWSKIGFHFWVTLAGKITPFVREKDKVFIPYTAREVSNPAFELQAFTGGRLVLLVDAATGQKDKAMVQAAGKIFLLAASLCLKYGFDLDTRVKFMRCDGIKDFAGTPVPELTPYPLAKLSESDISISNVMAYESFRTLAKDSALASTERLISLNNRLRLASESTRAQEVLDFCASRV